MRLGVRLGRGELEQVEQGVAGDLAKQGALSVQPGGGCEGEKELTLVADLDIGVVGHAQKTAAVEPEPRMVLIGEWLASLRAGGQTKRTGGGVIEPCQHWIKSETSKE